MSHTTLNLTNMKMRCFCFVTLLTLVKLADQLYEYLCTMLPTFTFESNIKIILLLKLILSDGKMVKILVN